MRKKLFVPLIAAAALSTLLLSSCKDVSIYTNPSLVIATYTYDDYLDPTRGESPYWTFIKTTKLKIAITIYMDNIISCTGQIYGGLSLSMDGKKGSYDFYSGTLENGVIHLNGSLGKIFGIELGNNWYLQVIDGTSIVSVAAPHSDDLFTDVSSTALTPQTASLTNNTYVTPGDMILYALKKTVEEKGLSALEPYLDETGLKALEEWKAANPEEAVRLEKAGE